MRGAWYHVSMLRSEVLLLLLTSRHVKKRNEATLNESKLSETRRPENYVLVVWWRYQKGEEVGWLAS